MALEIQIASASNLKDNQTNMVVLPRGKEPDWLRGEYER
jgi:hypothetical protein